MLDKGRRIHEHSLENLKLGAQARYQGKVRRNTSLLPATIAWLDAHGNASHLIDVLVASAKNGELKLTSDNTHNQIAETDSGNAHSQMLEAESQNLKVRLEQAEALLKEQNQASEKAHNRIVALQDELAKLVDQNDQLTREVYAVVEANQILREALSLRANAGGAIKDKIRETLKVLEPIEDRFG